MSITIEEHQQVVHTRKEIMKMLCVLEEDNMVFSDEQLTILKVILNQMLEKDHESHA